MLHVLLGSAQTAGTPIVIHLTVQLHQRVKILCRLDALRTVSVSN